jgi:hypothetical protein
MELLQWPETRGMLSTHRGQKENSTFYIAHRPTEPRVCFIIEATRAEEAQSKAVEIVADL